jgi:hypothetical protein
VQLKQGIKEIGQVAQVIEGAIEKSLKKYFGQRFSFIQVSSHSGINQVLNVRVGSSDIGDGLKEGESYPSIVSMVENDYDQRDLAQDYILRYILQESNELVEFACQQLFAHLIPPTNTEGQFSLVQLALPTNQLVSRVSSQLPIPPGALSTIRKRGFRYSTIELDLDPPDLDKSIIVDQLNADLQAYKLLEKSISKIHVKRKKALVESIAPRIDLVVRRASKAWSIYSNSFEPNR